MKLKAIFAYAVRIDMDTKKFKALLDEQMSWPDYYNFKFITKTEKKHLLLEELSDHSIDEKQSRNGKYTSITSRKILYSSEEVITVYKRVGQIEGVITL
ncbi:MAG: DUF493 family protein [Bacteriovoracaceae bacterium]|nr:DUF493 family protein [Bacteriovoracaceae bacterium]